MKSFFITQALALVLPAIIGPLTFLVAKYALNLWNWVDDLPSAVKQAVVLAIAFALTVIAQKTGFALPAECSGTGGGVLTSDCTSALSNPVFIKTVVSAALAFLLHALQKQQPAKS